MSFGVNLLLKLSILLFVNAVIPYPQVDFHIFRNTYTAFYKFIVTSIFVLQFTQSFKTNSSSLLVSPYIIMNPYSCFKKLFSSKLENHLFFLLFIMRIAKIIKITAIPATINGILFPITN